MVRTDGLLGIANRAHFDERIEQACSLAWRQERHVGLLMIDLDHFKRYNDWYGHRQGDICLQVVVRAVASVLKRDTDLLARYGGEELAVILPDTDGEGSAAVAERVCKRCVPCSSTMQIRRWRRMSPSASACAAGYPHQPIPAAAALAPRG
ncbi:MAG: hypothetical protein HKUEN07_37500 [Rhodocyclaceae bacterium]|nr:MAG: hypothetical protein HKUEN07_37500 [Rhodocyclaceae bacterium]